jgi:hypothetical protein
VGKDSGERNEEKESTSSGPVVASRIAMRKCHCCAGSTENATHPSEVWFYIMSKERGYAFNLLYVLYA